MLSQVFMVEAALAVGSVVASSVSCPTDLPVSCQNTTTETDLCCFNYPGGILLQTQFWDTDPATGPSDSWTVHGLWPDNCDGTYQEFCDTSREVTNVTAILKAAAPDTLSYMNTYWKDDSGDDETFWEHEFNKHGTCISTFDSACYTDYEPTMEVPDFFTRTVDLFKTLPSYEWLAAAGITPSSTKTYTLAAIQSALAANRDSHAPIVNCNSDDELDELWYMFHVQGSAQTGTYIPIDPVGSPTCPDTGIKYLPKSGSSSSSSAAASSTTFVSSTTTPASTAPSSTPSSGTLSGQGYFYVSTSSSSSAGYLVSAGKWISGSGTPATYTATSASGGFTLKSSKGSCAVSDSDGSLSCSSSVSSGSVFGYDGTYLTYSGSSDFYAESTPTGTTQAVVYAKSQSVTLQLKWSAK